MQYKHFNICLNNTVDIIGDESDIFFNRTYEFTIV